MAVSAIKDSLKLQGVRLTRQRQILLDLIDQSGRHLDAERLYELAREIVLARTEVAKELAAHTEQSRRSHA